MSNNEKNFSGIYAVVVTPFKKDGSFDLEAAKRHLDWLSENGIKGVCLLGATGEYQSITNKEHIDYIRQIVPYIKERMSIIVGVSRERPDDVIELMNSDEQAGVDAAMILSPFYCHPSQNEILENYRYIASKTTLPIMIYNNPGSAGVDISRETLKQVLSLPSARILKESTGDIRRLTEAVLDAPAHVSVFCGCDNLAMESFVMGATGWISMVANFAPKDCVALYDMVCSGQIGKAKEIYAKLMPALNMLETVEKPSAAIKYVLKKYRGIDTGFMRRPRLDLTEKEKQEVDNLLDYAAIC